MNKLYWRLGSLLMASGGIFSSVQPSHASDDHTAPTISIAEPIKDSTVSSLPSIHGSDGDNVGVVRVDLFLQRKSDNKYWKGNEWVTAATALNTSLSGSIWGRTSDLPSGANLASGAYFTAARAYDAAGNGTSVTENFTVGSSTKDTTPPTITISTPVKDSTVSSLPTINGTDGDNIGVVRVDLFLQRKSDNKYWKGNEWTATATPLTTSLSGSTWACSSPLPSGVNLTPGAYFTAARAYDAAGNGTSVTENFTVGSSTQDKTPPTIAISAPVKDSTVTSLPSINGTDGDNVGVVRVDLFLQRKSDNKYWNGHEWTATATPLTTTLSGDKWGRSSDLPHESFLTPGAYFTAARAYDAAGNGTSVTENFTVGSSTQDTTPPTITIAEPVKDSTVTALPSIHGNDGDNVGVVRVDLFLQRKSDNKYWNGHEWTATVTTLTTSLSGSIWGRTSDLPSGDNLVPGTYFTAARAYDAAGNGTSVTENFTVGSSTQDKTPPTITISTPVKDSTVTSLPSINGTDGDNIGVVRVDLFLQRKSDNKYWKGNEWTATATPLTTTLSGSTWTCSSPLPSGSNLAPGAYFTAARAYDAAGNGTSVTENFTVGSATFAYAGKYDVAYNRTDYDGPAASNGTFVLTVDAQGHATASFLVPSLKVVAGTGTFSADNQSFHGTLIVHKTSTGDSFVGSYEGTSHVDGDDADNVDTVSMTVNSDGSAVISTYSQDDGASADFSGTVNLSTGAITVAGFTQYGTAVSASGTLVRHNGMVSLSGNVTSAGVLSSKLSNDYNANGDTFAGDLDSVGTAPLRGSGFVYDTGVNDDGQGDGSSSATWTSTRQ